MFMTYLFAITGKTKKRDTVTLVRCSPCPGHAQGSRGAVESDGKAVHTGLPGRLFDTATTQEPRCENLSEYTHLA
jgi:hypothetical protein